MTALKVPSSNLRQARPEEIRNISGFLRNSGRFFDDYLGEGLAGSGGAGDGRGSTIHQTGRAEETDDATADERERATQHDPDHGYPSCNRQGRVACRPSRTADVERGGATTDPAKSANEPIGYLGKIYRSC
jgi:hypothetical protein